MRLDQLGPNVIIKGPIFPEPVQIIIVSPVGAAFKVIAKGLKSGRVHEPILSLAQLDSLEAVTTQTFDGDAVRFRLAIEALRLGLAYEYDPYFALSIARVDPLPHQLEAVYDYFLELPRIRFLLADDPGAGKTIMAGLLLKELKIRGLVQRTLIVTPANLTFQWQRELQDKFHEKFEVIRGSVLRANYGQNPWQDRNQVITSISWVSRIEEAKDSLLRSHWDLIIVDEAHKMSAYNAEKKTLAYQLGELLSEKTDHYLLMTATPHKGDPENFCLFLALLDRDVYGDVSSLEEALKRSHAPFYLRRTKEALVSFPDTETGEVKKLFTRRHVRTVPFEIDADEWDFYDQLTRYVEDQSIKAQADDTARGRALSFTMAMLQRRFASSVYAVRRSLERMQEKRRKILDDPEAWRCALIEKKLPDDFDELPEDEQEQITEELEAVVASYDRASLCEEILQLDLLIRRALDLEKREIESKLVKLKEVLTQNGIFCDPKMKLLVFTEHKDTLDYLVRKLTEWGLSLTQIHGSMKIGDRDMPGTRISSEREFREQAQVLVATEAAGEGINLQFCWFMINYDIPWNPVRLEQRMGRIHRYGQERDCLVLNFVSTNTREGRVLEKLFDRLKQIEKDLDPEQTGQVFNVLGEVFPANQLERMIREMYARSLTEEAIKERIVQEVDLDRIRQITESALEGLAKKELNLSALIGKHSEAKERCLVPEVIEDFFVQAAPLVGFNGREIRAGSHVYRPGRVPRNLWPRGDQLEPRFGKLGREYARVTFDKELLKQDATLEWVTPGHPLFEVVREETFDLCRDDCVRGATFYDLHSREPYLLDFFSASVLDGRGNVLHRRLFAVQIDRVGMMTVRQPTILLDLSSAPAGTEVPPSEGLPGVPAAERTLIERTLQAFLDEVAAQRKKEIRTITRHLELSLNTLIDRQNRKIAELCEIQEREGLPLSAANLKLAADRLDELNGRLEKRQRELQMEAQLSLGDIRHLGRAWVLPHPERNQPEFSSMIRSDEVEKQAVDAVIAFEEARGWQVESVEDQNRGFDLISRRPHPEDPKTAVEVRFIEVKGRARIGEVALTSNEYKTAQRLKNDFWLYVVYNCEAEAEIHAVRDPARLGWQPIVKVEHYIVPAKTILEAAK